MTVAPRRRSRSSSSRVPARRTHTPVAGHMSQAFRDLLNSPPDRGERNDWIMRVAAKGLHAASPAKVRMFLLGVVANSGWTDRDFEPEIDRAIERVLESMEQPQLRPSKLAWPVANADARRSRFDHPRFFEMSDTDVVPVEDLMPQLFLAGSLVCVANDVTHSITAPMSQFQGSWSRFSYLVANPMRALFGTLDNGHLSPRCLDNSVTDAMRRYIVVEFDTGDAFEDQIAVLCSLSSREIPLVLATFSGNKSIHAWYDGAAVSTAIRHRYFRHAVFLGADRSLWNPAALVRMPGGSRADGRHQTILYFRRPV